MPQGNLPEGARKIFEAAEKSAKSGTCKNREDAEACAAKIAWSAVKKKYKKVGDKWVRKESEALAQFSMAIVKAPFDNDTGEMRWRSVNSDTEEDLYNDEMTMELYADFMERIKEKSAPPEKFCSDFWSGGIPYLSISHYPDLNGDGVPGKVDEIFIDGNKLKSFGTFDDTPLGKSCWKAIRKDLYSEERSEASDKVRVSIAFLDWKHEHKSNGYIFNREETPEEMCPECFEEFVKSLLDGEVPQGKKFLKGQLIHLALTRVPVNTRTVMEVDKSMADEIKTRLDDATSIVGEEEAEKLEELAKETLQSESLVIKAETEEKAKKKKKMEDEEEEEMEDEKKEKKKSEVASPEGFPASEGVPGGTESEQLSEVMEQLKSLIPQKTSDPHPLDDAYEALKATYDEALSVDFSTDEALQLIQDPFNELGRVVRETISEKPAGEPDEGAAVAKKLDQVLSTITERLEGIEQTQSLMQAQLSAGNQTVMPNAVPQRRSVQMPVQQMPPGYNAPTKKKSETPKLRALVEQTLG